MISNTDFLGFTVYESRKKIEDLYSKTVDTFITQFSAELTDTTEGEIRAGATLGKLLSIIGVGASIDAQLTKQHAKSTQVVAELSTQQELLIALNALEKVDGLSDLNASLRTSTPYRKWVYFKCDANFAAETESLIRVNGVVENKKFAAYCSTDNFAGYSVVPLILSTPSLPVFCFGNILSEEDEILKMTFLYIGGTWLG